MRILSKARFSAISDISMNQLEDARKKMEWEGFGFYHYQQRADCEAETPTESCLYQTHRLD